MHVAPPFIWGLAAFAILYVAVAGYLMRYLECVHRQTWEELGSPSMFGSYTPQNSLATVQYVFGSKFRQLHDPRLSVIIWILRAPAVILIVLFVVGLVFNLLPQH